MMKTPKNAPDNSRFFLVNEQPVRVDYNDNNLPVAAYIGVLTGTAQLLLDMSKLQAIETDEGEIKEITPDEFNTRLSSLQRNFVGPAPAPPEIR